MIEQVLKARRAFIGYPPHRLGQNVGENNFRKGLYDISGVQDWPLLRQSIIQVHNKNYANQVAGNINLVRDAVPGSIILVPRPDRGLVYAGTVKKFELIDDPRSEEWGENYIESRIKNKLNKSTDNMATHVQDLAQSFLIEETDWIKIPFVSFPIWMQRTFFGRSTTSRLRGMKRDSTSIENLNLAHAEARRLMDKASRENSIGLIPEWTHNREEAKQRLRDQVGTESFEHLVVALLQLENEDEKWMQCGGSGDGGIDGIGTTSDGAISLLQCKWEFQGKSFNFGKTVHGTKINRHYFAYLNGPDKGNIEFTGEVCILDADKITNLIQKHSQRLPMAIALRIRANSS